MRCGEPVRDVELFEFPPGLANYPSAARDLRRMSGFDVVHAHFGLTAWPALAVRDATRVVTLHGTDLRHPRCWRITKAALGRMDLVAAASDELAARSAAPAGHGRRGAAVRRRPRPLPPLDRAESRARLGLDPTRRSRSSPPTPRARRSGSTARRSSPQRAGAQLLTLGHVPPDEVPHWVNAANVVLVPVRP